MNIIDGFSRQHWWSEEEGAEVHGAVFGHATSLISEDNDRLDRLRAWYALYRDRPDPSIAAAGYFRERLTRSNILQSGIDAVHSRHARTRPLPSVLTTAGSPKRQRKAKQLTRYMEGEFNRLDAHRLGKEVLLDGLIMGTGVAKGTIGPDGMPHLERVWVGEIYVDPLEEEFNCIRTVYQIKAVDKRVLMALYPGKEDLIEKASPPDDAASPASRVYGDIARVVEVWHLPSGKDVGDGRRAVCVSNATLCHEEWEHDRFPFVFFRPFHDPRSFWGIGMAERMAGTQTSLNRILEKNDESFDLSSPYLITSASAGFIEQQVDNAPWRVFTVNGDIGNAVMPVTPPAISEQHLRREDQLREQVLVDQGVSQLSAHAEKPAGLNSGKAMLVHQDVETGRHAHTAQEYESFFTDLAKLDLMLLEDSIAEMGEDEAKKGDKATLKVLVEQGGMLHEIKYTDVRMGDEPYVVKVFPVSSLSHSPQGRLSEVSDLNQLGLVTDKGKMLQLLDMPDLSSFTDRETAMERLADMYIEKALDGEKVTAHGYLPLDYALDQAVKELCLAELQGSPSKALEELRNFIGQLESIQKRQMASMQPPPMAAPPGPPGAPPMAPQGPPQLVPPPPGAA